ncbi:MAG: HNH endonuclease [Rudanella sp.]|nr:HNH endonuclease [Rudanella sp.]
MRPIFRGPVPTDAAGQPKKVRDYKDWRADLIDRIGNYCCYCNMVLNDSPQVEHVTPKNPQPGQVAGSLLDWDNMLLACGPCNQAKGNKPCSTGTHFLPDSHNTHMAFEHIVVDSIQRPGMKACLVKPRPDLTNTQTAKAQNTIGLCQLDRIVVNKRATDYRWKYRHEALLYAQEFRTSWETINQSNADQDYSSQLLPLIRIAALAKGFFSIWFEAFHDVPVVLQSLIAAFPNTEPSCFDAANGYAPVPRNPADL